MTTSSNELPLVTLVIPALNEEENLPELYRRVDAVLDGIDGYRFECLLIDNCSQDGTEQLGRERAQRDPRWHYLRFSRNFSAENSLAAGLHYARGDALVILPSDLQEPPECIPTMIEKWEQGYQVVYGVLRDRSDNSRLKSLGARVAYRVIYWLSEIDIPPNATDFRLITRPVIEALQRCDERNRYLRGLVHWTGFRQTSFEYNRDPRKHGESTIGFRFLVDFAINALVVFSTRPLRWASGFGLIVTLLSAAAAVLYAVLKGLSAGGWIDATPPPAGWTTMMLVILMFGGIHSLFMGIVGEYLAKVYVEVKGRPLWVLESTAGFTADRDPLGNARP